MARGWLGSTSLTISAVPVLETERIHFSFPGILSSPALWPKAPMAQVRAAAGAAEGASRGLPGRRSAGGSHAGLRARLAQRSLDTEQLPALRGAAFPVGDLLR